MRIFQVDSFTNKPFTGNPAGVCILSEDSGFRDVKYRKRFDYSVEVESEEIVGGINPNFDLLKKVPSRGIIVMGRADTGKYDFVSRFFAPAIGG